MPKIRIAHLFILKELATLLQIQKVKAIQKPTFVHHLDQIPLTTFQLLDIDKKEREKVAHLKYETYFRVMRDTGIIDNVRMKGDAQTPSLYSVSKLGYEILNLFDITF
ncbi:hypothetical protein NEF87_004897 [Candidatus Lokiarchaeum ossiferum]|uniref:ArnR1-like winged helix-turn-helix domain-containing protein n=1 Tax=Candidatus Lokiarchaeum ossiferum TaxID=2951803 RepID=A0ABY6I0G2_9ARCH|nr:hypothetical protein NEF87_004897 [Candidatus Lokiarchaeum sp. B-35]